MSDGRRDAESELRHQLAEQAKLEVKLLRASSATTPDAAIGRLIDRAFGDPARLRGAAALLGEKDQEALALLARAQRLAAFPVQDPRPPKPFSPPGSDPARLSVPEGDPADHPDWAAGVALTLGWLRGVLPHSPLGGSRRN